MKTGQNNKKYQPEVEKDPYSSCTTQNPNLTRKRHRSLQ